LKLTYESEVYTRRHFRVWVINWLIHSFINYIYIYIHMTTANLFHCA
jgi:hypothetical protein